MGYASYLEDIRDRLAEDLALMAKGIKKLEGRLDAHGTSGAIFAEQLQRMKVIHRQCTSLHTEISKLLDLGTSPEVDMAFELTKVKVELERLKLSNTNYYKKLAASDEKLLHSEEENKKLKREIKELNRIINDPKNFAAALEAYSDVSSMERLKSNEVKGKR